MFLFLAAPAEEPRPPIGGQRTRRGGREEAGILQERLLGRTPHEKSQAPIRTRRG